VSGRLSRLHRPLQRSRAMRRECHIRSAQHTTQLYQLKPIPFLKGATGAVLVGLSLGAWRPVGREVAGQDTLSARSVPLLPIPVPGLDGAVSAGIKRMVPDQKTRR
jgi:hypothetical protein